MAPVDPPRQARVPAIQVRIEAGEHTAEMWVRKYDPREVRINGTPHVLSYNNVSRPLGFDVKLNRFEIVNYPGTRRPRSFESSVTVSDPVTGRTEDRLISMNNPFSYGGYTLYQSSYRMGQGPAISYLSVGRDPGLPVVFAGYFSTIAGMILVLGLRMNDRRKLQRAEATVRVGTPSHTRLNRQAETSPTSPAPAGPAGRRARVRHGTKPRNEVSTKR
jgi:cytochrome c biogenesis protein ResB